MSTAPENDAATRRHWWPRFDLSLVLLLLLGGFILLLLTFELWVPHPFSN